MFKLVVKKMKAQHFKHGYHYFENRSKQKNENFMYVCSGQFKKRSYI